MKECSFTVKVFDMDRGAEKAQILESGGQVSKPYFLILNCGEGDAIELFWFPFCKMEIAILSCNIVMWI